MFFEVIFAHKNKFKSTMSTETYYNVSGGFGAIAAAFVLESLERILVWLMVMTAVII